MFQGMLAGHMYCTTTIRFTCVLSNQFEFLTVIESYPKM